MAGRKKFEWSKSYIFLRLLVDAVNIRCTTSVCRRITNELETTATKFAQPLPNTEGYDLWFSNADRRGADYSQAVINIGSGAPAFEQLLPHCLVAFRFYGASTLAHHHTPFATHVDANLIVRDAIICNVLSARIRYCHLFIVHLFALLFYYIIVIIVANVKMLLIFYLLRLILRWSPRRQWTLYCMRNWHRNRFGWWKKKLIHINSLRMAIIN